MSSEIHQPSYIVNEGLQELQENKEQLVGSFGTGLGSRATCTLMKKNRVCKAHFRCAACCVKAVREHFMRKPEDCLRARINC